MFDFIKAFLKPWFWLFWAGGLFYIFSEVSQILGVILILITLCYFYLRYVEKIPDK